MIHTIRSYLQQFSFSSFYGKCGKYANKILSVVLAFIMLFTFALPTFAVDVDVSNGEWKIVHQIGYYNDNSKKYVSGTSATMYSNDNVFSNNLDLSSVRSLNSSGKYMEAYTFTNVSNGSLATKDYNLRIELKNNGTHLDTSGCIKLSACNFVVNVYDLKGNSYVVNDANISFDNDSSSTFTMVVEIPYQSFDIYRVRISQYYKLSDFSFYSDATKINHLCLGPLLVSTEKADKTTDIIQSVDDKLDSVDDKIESVDESVKSLPEKIADAIKGLFIPDENFFDEKKAEMELFLEEHFGVIYTAPNIVITIFKKLLTISPGEPSLTMPAIEFDFLGEHIKLCDPITMNLYDFVAKGTPLYSIYQFYWASVTAFLIFLFVEYAINKYNYLFGKDGEAVN